MAQRGRTRVLTLEERMECSDTIKRLLKPPNYDSHGKQWTLRSLAAELQLSAEAVRKGQDPNKVGPALATALRDRFGLKLKLPNDSPMTVLQRTIEKLTSLGVANPEGVAIHLAIEGHLAEQVGTVWRARVSEVADSLVEDGWERTAALSAVAAVLRENPEADALTLYRTASRNKKA